MKFLSKILGFEGETYHDHNGQPSSSRKKLAAAMAALILTTFVGMGIAAFIDPKKAEMVHKFYSTAATVFATVITAGMAAVQGAKAHAESNKAKAKAQVDAAKVQASTPIPSLLPPDPPKKD